MLTLTDQRRGLAGCNVYRDDSDDLHWYYIPDKPSLALDDNGDPIFSLVMYRRPPDNLTDEERKTRLGGGLLTLSTALVMTEAQEDEIRANLANDPALHQRLTEGDLSDWWNNEIARDPEKLQVALKLSTAPVIGGTVSVAILGESTDDDGTTGDFTTSIVGGGRVSMTGSQRMAIQAKLTMDGAILLWNMLDEDLPAILVRYDLKFHHRLDAVEMVVWADAEKIYAAFQNQWQVLNDDASWSEQHTSNSSTYRFSHNEKASASDRLLEIAVQSQSSGVEIIPEAPISPEVEAELMRTGNQLLADFLTSTFLNYEVGGDIEFDQQPTLETELAEARGKEYGHHGIEHYNLKSQTDMMFANLEHRFKSKQVMEGWVGPQDNLADILGGRDPEQFRAQITLDDAWYKYLDVQIVCTTDFEHDPVDLVKAHLEYKGSGDLGDTHQIQDYIFKKDSPPGEFRAFLSSLDHREYDYELEVFYSESDTTQKLKGRTDETILILDTDAMGILRVNVQMGLIDWERIRQVRLDMHYGEGIDRKETQFTLDKSSQSRSWVEVIGKTIDRPYSYTVTLVDTENQRITLPEQRSRSRELVIDSPLGEEMEVRVVPVGVFGADGYISRILVSLRYTDTTNDFVESDNIELVKATDSGVWKVALINKELRSYEYQVKVIYSDGVLRETGWKTSDDAVITVGDPFSTRVQIVPTLLNIPPGRFAFGKISLTYQDDNNPNALTESTLLINSFTENLGWRFRMVDATKRTYRYQLTLYTAEGAEIVIPEQLSNEEVLVLKAPPAQ